MTWLPPLTELLRCRSCGYIYCNAQLRSKVHRGQKQGWRSKCWSLLCSLDKQYSFYCIAWSQNNAESNQSNTSLLNASKDWDVYLMFEIYARPWFTLAIGMISITSFQQVGQVWSGKGGIFSIPQRFYMNYNELYLYRIDSNIRVATQVYHMISAQSWCFCRILRPSRLNFC